MNYTEKKQRGSLLLAHREQMNQIQLSLSAARQILNKNYSTIEKVYASGGSMFLKGGSKFLVQLRGKTFRCSLISYCSNFSDIQEYKKYTNEKV